MVTIAAMMAALAFTQMAPAISSGALTVQPKLPEFDAATKAAQCLGLDLESAKTMAKALKVEERLPSDPMLLENITLVHPSETSCGFVQDVKAVSFQQNATPLAIFVLQNQKTGKEAAYLFIDLGPAKNGGHIFAGKFMRENAQPADNDANPS